MKIVIAPDSFKGSLSAREAAEAIAAGVRDARPDAEIVIVPLADGGEGTVDALAAAVPGSVKRTVRVRGPLGDPVDAEYGLLGPERATAVVEMAAASGITLIQAALPRPLGEGRGGDRRDPMRASTYGTGELMRAAAGEPGIEKLIIGLGGSATNDCGAGALAALGVRFLDAEGLSIASPSPLTMASIENVDVSRAIPGAPDIQIACDVTNPLTGPSGATAIFGPQKGVTPEMVGELDAILGRFCAILDEIETRRCSDLGISKPAMPLANRPGAGAAGGLAAGLMALFPAARLRSGIDLVLDVAAFDDRLAGADLLITGEGKLDAQTLSGKTILGVLRRAHAAGVPSVAIAGSVDPDAASRLSEFGPVAAYSLVDRAGSVAAAIAHAAELLSELGARAVQSSPSA